MIATTSTDEEVAFVQDYGADDVVDYRGDLADAVRDKRPGGVDAVLHFAGDRAHLATLISPKGRLVSTVGLGADQVHRDDISVITIMANPVTATLAQVADAVTPGTIRVPVDRPTGSTRFPRASQTSPPANAASSLCESSTDPAPTRPDAALSCRPGERNRGKCRPRTHAPYALGSTVPR